MVLAKGASFSCLVIAVLALLAFANTLLGVSFIRDDWFIIAENPILRSSGAFFKVWTSGYWESALGSAAPVALYRPVILLSHWAERALFGLAPGPMHATNVILHALNAVLALGVFRRLMAPRAAWFAAAAFAVMPIHAEAVANIVNRTELFAAAGMLGAWLLLFDETRPLGRMGGFAAYALALFSKEHAILFPVFLALGEWTFAGRKPWEKSRRSVYLSLGLVTAIYLALRWHALERPFDGGEPYFAPGVPVLVRALSVARFWVEKYLWPSVTGLGLADDFARPLIPDARMGEGGAWVCLLGLAGLFAAAAREALKRRASWAFWALLPPVFLLPTAHLLPFCALGAQRLFYFPSLSVAAAFGALAGVQSLTHRRATFTVAGAFIIYGLMLSVQRGGVYASEVGYYADVVAGNPVSYGGRIGYGLALLRAGLPERAAAEFRHAIEMDGRGHAAFFNLGKMAWEAGDVAEAERRLNQARGCSPKSASTLAFLGLVSETRGRLGEAEGLYAAALEIQPLEPVAMHNLGLLYFRENKTAQGRAVLERFLAAFPEDEAAPGIRGFLSRLGGHRDL